MEKRERRKEKGREREREDGIERSRRKGRKKRKDRWMSGMFVCVEERNRENLLLNGFHNEIIEK